MTYYYEYEKKTLRPYAQFSPKEPICISRNWSRDYHESRHRTPWQKDRDKIVYSPSFRALEQKTQLFIREKYSQTRSRMTHTIEVYSIATEIGRKLGLNVDLIQAISFGHDIGHAPFGHAGERFFSETLGGFYHNCHGVKVIGDLDYFGTDWNTQRTRYGLNVTIEVAEGVLKHTDGREYSYLNNLNGWLDETYGKKINLETPGTLESQVVAVSDEIAQKTADIADARRLGLVEQHDITELYTSVFENPKTSYADYMIDNVLDNFEEIVETQSEDELKDGNKLVVFISDKEKNKKIKKFLETHVYNSRFVDHFDELGVKILTNLFDYYSDCPIEIGTHYYEDRQKLGDSNDCKVVNYLCSLNEREIIQKIFSDEKVIERFDSSLIDEIKRL